MITKLLMNFRYKIMKTMWEFNPANRPTFESIRQKLSGFLEVTSDSYGYIQVSRDYGALYSLVQPPSAPLTEEVLTVEDEIHVVSKAKVSFAGKSQVPSTSIVESSSDTEPASTEKTTPYIVSGTSSISKKKFQMSSEKELNFNSETKLHLSSDKGFHFSSGANLKSKSSIEIIDETTSYSGESIV